MSTDEYRRALDAASREWEQLSAEKTRIDARLAQLTQSIRTLVKLCGFEATVPWSLTDACRTVLLNAGRPMTAIEVRDALAAILDLDRYANPLAAIHTTLKRLAETDHVTVSETDEARRMAFEARAPRAVVPGVRARPAKARGADRASRKRT